MKVLLANWVHVSMKKSDNTPMKFTINMTCLARTIHCYLLQSCSSSFTLPLSHALTHQPPAASRRQTPARTTVADAHPQRSTAAYRLLLVLPETTPATQLPCFVHTLSPVFSPSLSGVSACHQPPSRPWTTILVPAPTYTGGHATQPPPQPLSLLRTLWWKKVKL